MATTSAPPPPPGGNLKFVAIGLIFLLAAGGLWMAVGKQEPAPEATQAKPAGPARVNPMADTELELEAPVAEPDAAVAVVPVEEPKKRAGSGGSRGDEWDCSGDLKGAASVINDQRPQVRTCYERRLKVNNILQGDLSVKLKVGSNGKVLTAAVSGNMKDTEVNTCVRKLAAQWEFAPPSGGNCAVLQVPFHFSPKN